jgi:hypothetical protein
MSIELSLVKDIVYIFAASAGFVLGFLGYYRSGVVERKVSLQPYFKGVWNHISEDLGSLLKLSEGWVLKIENELATTNPEEFSLCLATSKELNIDNYDWEYDKDIFRKLAKYVYVTSQLHNEVKSFNYYRYFTTSGASVVSGLERIQYIEGSKNREMITKILKEFNLPLNNTTFEKLSKHKPYRRRINRHKKNIKSLTKELQRLISDLKRRKSAYDFTFEITKLT